MRWSFLRILAIFITFMFLNGCRKNESHKETNIDITSERLLEQVFLSSKIYNTPFYVPENYEAPKLIYRYSDSMCEGCVFEDLENLKDFQGKIGKDHILVFPAFNNDRRNLVRHRYELAVFNYRVLSTDSLIIPVHEIEGYRQYFAVMNCDGKLEMVFFPKRGHSTITQAYFAEVEKRLSK